MARNSSSSQIPAVNPIEVELNNLRSFAAALKGPQAAQLKARIDALEAHAKASAKPMTEGEETRARIMHLLATAQNGKPGSLTTPEIENRLGLTRSAAHVHIIKLEKDGHIVIRKTHGDNGRPVFLNYHHAAVRFS